MLFKDVQFANAIIPTLSTESGILMLVKYVQSSNASSPMLLTEFGIFMLVISVFMSFGIVAPVMVFAFLKTSSHFAFASCCLFLTSSCFSLIIFSTSAFTSIPTTWLSSPQLSLKALSTVAPGIDSLGSITWFQRRVSFKRFPDATSTKIAINDVPYASYAFVVFGSGGYMSFQSFFASTKNIYVPFFVQLSYVDLPFVWHHSDSPLYPVHLPPNFSFSSS